MEKKIIIYKDIISLANLHLAWREFVSGKKYKKDVAEFALGLSHSLYGLHERLSNKTYEHSPYEAFNINDPKPRNIHKAKVHDRLLHHAIYRILYPFFDKKFIDDSYSCRLGKGTHKAMLRFQSFARKVSKNNTKTCWVLKCDVRKFFASIDQNILCEILSKHISDKDIMWLLQKVIFSFHSTREGVGLPLGNLTSQLLVNIYMNEFDQHMKHKLKVKYYIRYADDFVILSEDKIFLESLIPNISNFLSEKLKLSLHPDKVFIKTLSSGVDFLGWVHFSNHRVLRAATRKRMFRKIIENPKDAMIASYVGMLSHGNAYTIRKQIETLYRSQ